MKRKYFSPEMEIYKFELKVSALTKSVPDSTEDVTEEVITMPVKPPIKPFG